MDIGLAPKADFILCRMNIHIHIAEREFDKQHDGGILTLHEQCLVTEQHRVGQYFIAYVAPVDERVEIPSVRKRRRRRAQICFNHDFAKTSPKRNESLRNLTTENLMQAIFGVVHRYIIGDISSIVLEQNMHGGISQGHAVHHAADKAKHGTNRIEQYSSCQSTELNIIYLDNATIR